MVQDVMDNIRSVEGSSNSITIEENVHSFDSGSLHVTKWTLMCRTLTTSVLSRVQVHGLSVLELVVGGDVRSYHRRPGVVL